MTDIGKKIRKYRKDKGLTQEDLAKQADIPYATLMKIESGSVTNPTIKTVKKLADGLEVSLDELTANEKREIEIIPIVELNNVGGIIQSIIPEATNENIKELALGEEYADAKGNIHAVVQSFVVKVNGLNIIIDTCNGNDKKRIDMPEWGNLQTNFVRKLEKEAGLKPGDINLVINTHLHFDHVGWNTKLENGQWEPTFRNAKYLTTKTELEYWTSKPENELGDDIRGIEDSIEPAIKAGMFESIEADYRLGESIQFIPSPGHTPGHTCVEINNNGEKIIIGGDLIYHPCQIHKFEWTAESDGDPKMVIERRKKIFDYIVNEEAVLIGMHFSGGIKIGKENNRYVIREKL